jgi:hypothetical protein
MEALVRLVDHPLFSQIAHSLAERKDPTLNKELVSLARHMGLAKGSGNFARITDRISTLLLSLPYLDVDPLLSGADPFLDSDRRIAILDSFLFNPFYAGALISLSYLLPLTTEQVSDIRMGSFMKEIQTMDGTNQDPRIDFTPFFGNYTQPIHPDISPNPHMAS